jgi:hypothetical protein
MVFVGTDLTEESTILSTDIPGVSGGTGSQTGKQAHHPAEAATKTHAAVGFASGSTPEAIRDFPNPRAGIS